MESFQYFVAKSDKYVLIRKIGNRNIPIVSDIDAIPIYSIYRKICAKEYASEKELFEDIFDWYSNKSVIPFLRDKNSTQ